MAPLWLHATTADRVCSVSIALATRSSFDLAPDDLHRKRNHMLTLKKILYSLVFVRVGSCMWVNYPRIPEEGVRSRGAGVTRWL